MKKLLPAPRRLRACALWLVVAALSACGGGGGGGGADTTSPPPDPGGNPVPAAGYSLGGTVSVAPYGAVDSDTNDVTQLSQGRYVVNDSLDTSQALSVPLLLVGTVNEVDTGPPGNNRSVGDADDYFRMDLVAGQVVELEFASDPADADVDLYVISTDGQHQGSSLGEDTRYECVQITTSGSYHVNVYAFRNASIYNLRVGAPGSAGACAESASAVRARSGELVARARPARLKQDTLSHVQRWGVNPAALAASAPGLPQLLRVDAPAQAGAAQRQATKLALAGQPSERVQAASAAATRLADLQDQLQLQKTAKHLKATGGFYLVHPNWEVKRQALVGSFPPNDRNYGLQRWHYEQINLPAAMSRIAGLATQPTQRPVVAVIDDGVALDHPDLQPQLYANGRAFISQFSAGDGNTTSGDNPSGPRDQSAFHGTHVAGTVAAATFNGVAGAGVAPMAQILPLRVFPPSGGAGLLDVTQAMLYAAGLPNNSGQVPLRRADVINLSLGSSRSCPALYQETVDQVRAAGVIVVAATGNEGRNDLGRRTAVGSPANCRGVIAVGALDALRRPTRYTNTGAEVALVAPGGDASQSTTGSGAPDSVHSTLATFDAGGRRQPTFGYMDGTSMATPHVAGVLALMRYVNPTLSVEQVDELLAAGAMSTDLGTAGRDIDHGFGLVDARKAVDAALQAAGTTTPAPAGQVLAQPSTIDFGSFQTSAVLELATSAATTETVSAIGSDNAAVTVEPLAVVAATRLGRYTVRVNRAALAAGTSYPRLNIALSSGRSLGVQLSVTRPAAGTAAGQGDFGPMYVLLLDPATGNVRETVIASYANGSYRWSLSGWTLPSVSVVAGTDMDNDNQLCQRGEPCGAYPVLAPGRDLTVVTLAGNRTDLDLQAAPLSGISAMGLPTLSSVPAPRWRRADGLKAGAP